MYKMKKVTVIAGLLLGGLLVAFTPKPQNAPKKVTDAFSTMFPNAKHVTWDKENAKEWEAEFKLNGKDYSANFLEDGTWKETEHEIKNAELPSNLKMEIKKKYPDYKISESEISETAQGAMYEVMLEKGEKGMEIVANKQGTIVSQKSAREDDED